MENKTIFEWAEIFQEQIQNGASQSDIIQMLDEYGNQALRIHDVVGQSEQLKAFREWYDSLSQEETSWYEGRYEDVFLSL